MSSLNERGRGRGEPTALVRFVLGWKPELALDAHVDYSCQPSIRRASSRDTDGKEAGATS